MRISAALIFLLIAGAFSGASASDWLQWRGPNHNNVANGAAVPTEWDESKNVKWKVEVPGRGHSSPTIIGNLIVLTSADEAGQRQAVFGFDRNSGKQLWQTIISTGGFPATHPKNTHASATACSDGKHIFVVFNHHAQVEAAALSLTGEILWQKNVGPFKPRQYEYGYAASPTFHNGRLIISGDCDTSGWLVALEGLTGEVAWQQQRPKMLNWSSPVIATVAGKQQMLISGCEQLASYDPDTGKPLWSAACLTMATCGTCVFNEDTVFASGGYPKRETVAVKADGSGEILWRNRVKCYEQSMLYHDGYLYAVDDTGVAYCWNARTGKEQWKTRLRGPVSASPLLVGDNIFLSNELGTTFVFKANPKAFTPVAKNQLGSDSFSTPVAVDGVLYLRHAVRSGRNWKETLYAIGQ